MRPNATISLHACYSEAPRQAAAAMKPAVLAAPARGAEPPPGVQAPHWLTPHMAGCLHALQAACPAAAGLLDDLLASPEQWHASLASHDASLPEAWQSRLSDFQTLLLHKVCDAQR